MYQDACNNCTHTYTHTAHHCMDTEYYSITSYCCQHSSHSCQSCPVVFYKLSYLVSLNRSARSCFFASRVLLLTELFFAFVESTEPNLCFLFSSFSLISALLKFLPLTGDNVSPNLSARLRRTSELAAPVFPVLMGADIPNRAALASFFASTDSSTPNFCARISRRCFMENADSLITFLPSDCG